MPVRLDVTVPGEVQAAAEYCQDADLLVSNAGQACSGAVLAAPDLALFRSVFEVNFFGPLVNELRVSGICAFVAAAALWYRATSIVLAIGKGPAAPAASSAPTALSSPVTSN